MRKPCLCCLPPKASPPPSPPLLCCRLSAPLWRQDARLPHTVPAPTRHKQHSEDVRCAAGGAAVSAVNGAPSPPDPRPSRPRAFRQPPQSPTRPFVPPHADVARPPSPASSCRGALHQHRSVSIVRSRGAQAASASDAPLNYPADFVRRRLLVFISIVVGCAHGPAAAAARGPHIHGRADFPHSAALPWKHASAAGGRGCGGDGGWGR